MARRTTTRSHLMPFAFLLAALAGQASAQPPAEQPKVKELGRITGFPDWVYSVAFSPDGKLLAAGSAEIVQIHEADTRKLVQSLKVKTGDARDLAFSPDGKLLAAGAYRATILWDTDGFAQKHRLEGHRGYVNTVAFSPDGRTLATSSDDETVRFWNVEDGTPGLVIEGFGYPVNDVAWSPDGKLLATAAGDEDRVTAPGEVRLWDVATGKETTKFPDHEKAASAIAFSPGGQYVVSGSEDEKVNVYDVAGGKAIGFFGGHSRPTNCVLCYGDETVISGSGGRAKGKDEVKIWNREDGTEHATIEGHEGQVNAVTLSPDGKVLATASHDATVALWDVAPILAKVPQPMPTDAPKTKELRAGIIGLDTSHAIAFTKALNAKDPKPDFIGCRVVAAYPKGSPDIESSVSRVEGYTKQVREQGVEIVDSIDALLEKVDVVFLETNDGRPHLEQITPVLKAKKPVFIDKPVAGSLADAVAIYELAKKHNVPVFSSSALRFGAGAQELRNGKIGKIFGCDAYSPSALEPTHPDLFWYGIHGVETLFTVMGTGCKSVTRASTEDFDVVVGTWDDGRIGTFRGIRKGGSGYNGTAFGEKEVAQIGSFGGYDPLLVEIVEFFHTGEPPVSAEETLEIYAFMEAADESKRQGGAPVTLESVMEGAGKAAAAKLSDLE